MLTRRQVSRERLKLRRRIQAGRALEDTLQVLKRPAAYPAAVFFAFSMTAKNTCSLIINFGPRVINTLPKYLSSLLHLLENKKEILERR